VSNFIVVRTYHRNGKKKHKIITVSFVGIIRRGI
jgi:hypothetical protein